MEIDKRFASEEGVPTATVETPNEPREANATLAKDVKLIDVKLDLVLNALGVSATSLEGGDGVEAD